MSSKRKKREYCFRGGHATKMRIDCRYLSTYSSLMEDIDSCISLILRSVLTSEPAVRSTAEGLLTSSKTSSLLSLRSPEGPPVSPCSSCPIPFPSSDLDESGFALFDDEDPETAAAALLFSRLSCIDLIASLVEGSLSIRDRASVIRCIRLP